MLWENRRGTRQNFLLTEHLCNTAVENCGLVDRIVENDENATDLILQSPQPVVKVSADCQMFEDTIHPKSKQEKNYSLKYDGANK